MAVNDFLCSKPRMLAVQHKTKNPLGQYVVQVEPIKARGKKAFVLTQIVHIHAAADTCIAAYHPIFALIEKNMSLWEGKTC